jgi:lipid II:glycine glycyltransferase (peptidoglycan interpeptide bridge formation enzyme)
MTDDRTDEAGWDAFVSSTAGGSYAQLPAWAAVKAANGWSAVRLLTTTAGATADVTIGAQVLIRRVSPLPWSVGYAPRGPVVDQRDADWVDGFTALVRDRLADRIAGLTIDPEIERDGPRDADGALRHRLEAAGWRPADPVQPDRSRILELTGDEAALWSGLRSKWRQYVNNARRAGVTVVDHDESGIADFHRIYVETAKRAGFIIRAESAYRDVWRAYASGGRARLLLAHDAGGAPVAGLFLLRCGTRVVEPYGGMTEAGAELRANYLLKWEAIRSSAEAGAHVYDMWGLSHPGIAHFKAGFGGREVRYIGAWRLTLDPLAMRVIDAARRANVAVARRRRGLPATDG